MKKVLPLILLLAVVLGALASCTPKISTDGLLEAAPDLIKRSAYFNELYYGEGIPREEMLGPVIGVYYYASAAWIEEQGIRTVDQLKAKTEEVFSSDYCQSIYASAFSGAGGVYARYSSNQATNLKDENETILVSSTFLPMLTGEVSYDFSSVRIADVTETHATVGVMQTIVYPADEEYPDGHTETEELLIRFVYENGWRIDSATY